MSTHEEISQTIRAFILNADSEGVIDLSPTLLASKCFERYAIGDEDIHIQYAATEHYKQMSRVMLARRFDPDADESEATQGDMFSGHLQSRYPIRVKDGEQPIYRPREALSEADLDWNIAQLRKSAAARMKHADALQAYRDSKQLQPA
jgi:hypothetical protein